MENKINDNDQNTQHKQSYQYQAYFYFGWISHLIAMIVIFVVDWFLFSGNYLNGMSDSANAVTNIVFRFPIWSGITFIGTILLIFKKLPKFFLVKKCCWHF